MLCTGAFERFSSLLYGRIAPYFVTESELDSLLEVELPTSEHARQLRDLQLRFGQRIYFFGRLTHPAWVEPLAGKGFFSNPPVRPGKPRPVLERHGRGLRETTWWNLQLALQRQSLPSWKRFLHRMTTLRFGTLSPRLPGTFRRTWPFAWFRT